MPSVTGHIYDRSKWPTDLSGSTEQFTPDATGACDYVPASPGTTVEVANDTHEEVKGYGERELHVINAQTC